MYLIRLDNCKELISIVTVLLRRMTTNIFGERICLLYDCRIIGFNFSKKISHLTTLCFKFTNDERNNDFFFFFISRKEDKMPESTIPAARSSEPYPGYSVLEGQYELHETGKYISSKIKLQLWPKFYSFSEKACQARPLNICHYLTDHQHS